MADVILCYDPAHRQMTRMAPPENLEFSTASVELVSAPALENEHTSFAMNWPCTSYLTTELLRAVL